MEIEVVKEFCMVVNIGNVSNAAKAMNLSQSALSKHIANLEKEMKVPLFLRSGNKMELTPEGRQFYPHAQRIVLDYENAMNLMRRDDERCSIKVHINTTRHIFVPYLTNYLIDHPNIDCMLNFYSSQKMMDIVGGGFMYNFAIGGKRLRDYLDKEVRLMDEGVYLAVHKSHPLYGKREVSVGDLEGQGFVLQPTDKVFFDMNRTFRNYSQRFVNACERVGFSPQVKVYCDDSKYLCNLINQGIGLGIVPECSWDSLISEDVKLVPIKELSNILLTQSLYYYGNRNYSDEVIALAKGTIEHYHQYYEKHRKR